MKVTLNNSDGIVYLERHLEKLNKLLLEAKEKLRETRQPITSKFLFFQWQSEPCRFDVLGAEIPVWDYTDRIRAAKKVLAHLREYPSAELVIPE